MVELMKRYSNPVYQGRRLRQIVEIAEKSAKTPVREVPPPPQVQRVDRRLTPQTITELVQDYRDGVSTPELRQRYELSQGSVIKILHRHGVQMRGHGMTDDDLPAAAELYCRGATLAQLGKRFGVSPNAVRRALKSAGIVMRPRGGRKPRS
jgi:hypothetical protein